jgi:hypothetical protein
MPAGGEVRGDLRRPQSLRPRTTGTESSSLVTERGLNRDPERDKYEDCITISGTCLERMD